MQGDGKSFRVSRREAASGQRSKESQKASWSEPEFFSGHESLDNRLGLELYLTRAFKLRRGLRGKKTSERWWRECRQGRDSSWSEKEKNCQCRLERRKLLH